MGGKRLDFNGNNNPGPGSYSQDFEQSKSKTQTTKFGTSKRSDFLTKSGPDQPGPGNYSNTDARGFGKSGVQVTIKGKANQHRVSENPGPGAYNEINSISTVKYGGSIRFGTSKR